MRRSACFVAVVPFRRDEPKYKTSPFIVHEYWLAVRAQKPRLVFVEKGVPGSLFPMPEERQVFDRDELETYEEFGRQIEKLLVKGRGYATLADRLIGDVGLALPDTDVYREARAVITQILERVGYSVRPVRTDFSDPAKLTHELDGFEFVITDAASPQIPQWLYPMLFGRFVPTINLMYHDPVHGMSPAIPDLVAGETLRDATSSRNIVLWWSTLSELEEQLEAQVNGFELPRRQFRTLEEGIGYFRSVGRGDGSIFLSTTGLDGGLAREVGRALELQNFTFFHYVYKNTIPLGLNWQDRLDGLIQDSRVFVPLVSEAYWRSEWCRREFETARALRENGHSLDIIPYFLDGSGGTMITEQGVDLSDLAGPERAARIVRDMDRYFTDRAADRPPGEGRSVR